MAIQSFDEAMRDDRMPFVVTVDGTEYTGYFANIRIDRDTVPDDWHVYNIRHDDEGGEPCEIRNGYIAVNHFGTFYTKDNLPLNEGESLYSDEFEYSFVYETKFFSKQKP